MKAGYIEEVGPEIPAAVRIIGVRQIASVASYKSSGAVALQTADCLERESTSDSVPRQEYSAV